MDDLDYQPFHEPLSDAAIDQILRKARTHNAWRDRPVSDETLRELVALMGKGPTSANQSPARIIFVKSPAAKARLEPYLSSGNREKTMSAPVTAIIGYDMEFYEKLPKLFPHQPDAKSWFTTTETLTRDNAFRNGTLQGAYLMIAARALGLDCGGMSGFDNAGVDAEFFAGTAIRSNFLLNIGYGDPAGLMQRLPRFEFDEIAQII